MKSLVTFLGIRPGTASGWLLQVAAHQVHDRGNVFLGPTTVPAATRYSYAATRASHQPASKPSSRRARKSVDTSNETRTPQSFLNQSVWGISILRVWRRRCAPASTGSFDARSRMAIPVIIGTWAARSSWRGTRQGRTVRDHDASTGCPLRRERRDADKVMTERSCPDRVAGKAPDFPAGVVWVAAPELACQAARGGVLGVDRDTTLVHIM